jgi:hypothetical protein
MTMIRACIESRTVRCRLHIVVSLALLLASCGKSAGVSRLHTGNAPGNQPDNALFCNAMASMRRNEDAYAIANDPAQSKAAIDRVSKDLADAIASASDENKPAMTADREAFEPFLKVLAEAGYDQKALLGDSVKAQRLGPILKIFEDKNAAVDAIGARECGINPPET